MILKRDSKEYDDLDILFCITFKFSEKVKIGYM